MENLIELTSVPLIVTIVYFVLYIYKLYVKKEALIKLIPAIGAILGAVLGIASFYASPEVVPASNVLAALLVGAASGLSATGVNQIYKQLCKNGNCDTGIEAAEETGNKDAEEEAPKADTEEKTPDDSVNPENKEDQ